MKYLKREYLQELKRLFGESDKAREEMSNVGRSVTKHSKSTIYSLIRNDWGEAESEIEKMKKGLSTMESFVVKNSSLSRLADVPMQEYSEAMVLYYYLKEKRIPTHTELKVTGESFVLGLMDAAGELLRKSVEEMIAGNLSFAMDAKAFIEEVYRSMLELNFRNYELRRKVDYVSNTLNRLVEYIFEKT